MIDSLLKKIKNIPQLQLLISSIQSTEDNDSSVLNKSSLKMIKKLVNIIQNLDILVKKRTKELDEANGKLQEKEKKLTEYINKIFEKQETERIVKWIVNSIRESLNLEEVMATTVEEVGKLLNVDRCLISLFDQETSKFNLQHEYKKNEDILGITKAKTIVNFSKDWYNLLVYDNVPVVVNDVKLLTLNKEQKAYLETNSIKSFAITPVIHKGEILGIIIVHQIQYQRIWGDSHIEILKDIGSQIAIAIRQAALYTQVQETTRLKSEFLANMSHEFRTPLNAIIGFSEMLITKNYGSLTDKQSEYLNNIALSGKHLLRLVNDILDLSKVEAGSVHLEYEKFNPSQVILETLSILDNMAFKKNIKIKSTFCDAILNADKGRFRQIMYNLLSNAIKFTGEGGKISIITSIVDEKLKVEIIDSGIGIADKDKDKIFMQFRQLDSSYARKQEGTGLGLALTKKLIELHKGYINFESQEGQGSKFWFVLPEMEIHTDTTQSV